MDLEKIRRLSNPKEYFSKRSETLGTLNTEILLLKERVISESSKNSGRVMYQFPCNVMYCYDTRDVLSYKNRTELEIGLFQIYNIDIVYDESIEDEIMAKQSIDVVIKAHMLDVDNNDEKGFPCIKFENCVKANAELKDIGFDESHHLQILLGKSQDIFVLKNESFELIKDFIVSVKNELI